MLKWKAVPDWLSFKMALLPLTSPALKFKVAAKNIHGWGSDSALSAVQTTSTDVPDAPTNVLTTQTVSGLGVDITWNPITDNGATVTKVQVYIK